MRAALTGAVPPARSPAPRRRTSRPLPAAELDRQGLEVLDAVAVRVVLGQHPAVTVHRAVADDLQEGAGDPILPDSGSVAVGPHLPDGCQGTVHVGLGGLPCLALTGTDVACRPETRTIVIVTFRIA